MTRTSAASQLWPPNEGCLENNPIWAGNRHFRGLAHWPVPDEPAQDEQYRYINPLKAEWRHNRYSRLTANNLEKHGRAFSFGRPARQYGKTDHK